MSRVFLRAEWRYLAMVNFEVSPSVLEPLVPSGTELDEWGGRVYVSVVGFLFRRTRVLGVPVPFHVNFEELNLRFYVRRRAGDELRRGVVFVKEIVPRWAIATVARLAYNENYVAMPMRHALDLPDGARRGSVVYEWRSGANWDRVRLEIEGEPGPLVAGSEEEFITEHYWGYARQRDGGTIEYQVEHPPWRVWRAVAHAFECDAAALYGPRFAEAFDRPAVSAFVAEGSEILVRQGARMAGV